MSYLSDFLNNISPSSVTDTVNKVVNHVKSNIAENSFNKYSEEYDDAKEAGDAVGMRNANDKANMLRNKLGQDAQYANEDIAAVAGAQNNDDPDDDDYSDYIKEMYRSKTAGNLAALKSAYKDNVAALDAAEEQIPGTYQAARNQTFGTSSQEKQNFAEYAAGNGLNSGAGGQAELARSVALQGNLNSINQEEANALADLELQRTQLTNEYNSAIASAKADGDYELANALYQESVRADEALLNSSQLQKSWHSDDYNRKLQLAQYLAQYGDFSGFQALGIDTAKMEEAYAKENG